MKEEKTLSEIILECIACMIFTIILLTTLSLLTKSVELEEKYTRETIRLNEKQIQILEKIEDKIY